ncbi:RNA polymerase subunit sigma [Lysinibacillus sp. PLM2]|nr:RNA polymerase subunit sigma [Lysinibacillus sp. PLM2]
MDNREKEGLLREAMDTYGHYLKRVVYALVKDEQKAEDIVQEVFIRYYINLESFEGRASVKTFLYSIALNQCRNYFKSWSYRKILLSNIVQHTFVSKQTPESEMLKRESSKEIEEALGKLPFKYKEVIWLYYYIEMSVVEISEVLNCSVNTVKTRLARGRRQAKISLEEVKDHDAEY